VLQTHGDNLLASGATPGYCGQEAYDEARIRYEFVRNWLERSRATLKSGDWKIGVVIPAPYPRPQGPQGMAELRALRSTLETVEARLGADLQARRTDPAYDRLQPTLEVVESALDSSLGLSSGTPSPELQATLSLTLLSALDRAYEAGQLLAKPDLLAKPQNEKPAPAPTGATALSLFRPGDPAFDPWCLTDPIERRDRQADGVAAGMLDDFWRADPNPERTLSIQADIAGALEDGTTDYVPNEMAGSLEQFTRKCPWPGVLWAKGPLQIGGQQLDEGDRFVLAVGGSGEGFRCALVRLSAAAAAQFADADSPRTGAHVWGEASAVSVLDLLAQGIFDVFPF
jgi:hypothetical protein